MRSDHRAGLGAAAITAVLALALLLIGVLGLGTASADDPTDDPTATATTTVTVTASPTPEPREIDSAVLRWGLNAESSSPAYFGRNFLSAGKLPNRGSGREVAPGDWSARSGNVRIEQFSTGSGTFGPATWAGVNQGTAGDQQVVLTGGTGSVDPTDGAAEIRWTGSFSVVFYSGQSYFYVTDPVLSVDDGVATLTATLSGYGASRTDASQWIPLAATPVTLADLGEVDLDADDDGFNVTPGYRGVSVTVPSGAAAQVRTGADWGAFPQSFVDFQAGTGLSSFWYSSGSSIDARKVALPVSVSYDESQQVGQPTPTPSVPVKVTNSAIPAPSPTNTTQVTVTAAPVPAPPVAVLPSTAPVAVAASAVHPAPTVLALTSAETTPSSSPRWPWWVGTALLFTSAALVVLMLRRPRV